jgi:hypothetical protein
MLLEEKEVEEGRYEMLDQQGSPNQRDMQVLVWVAVRKRRLWIQHLVEETNASIRSYKATRKWKHLLRISPLKRKKDWKTRTTVKRQRSGPMLNTNFDIYRQTGLLAEEFLQIFKLVEEDLRRPRTGRTVRPYANQLVDRARLGLVLTFLRKGQDYNISSEWGVSPSYGTREVRFIIPILASRLSFLKLPKQWPMYSFEKVVGAIDCSSHFRNRVHPNNHDYYRGDKGAHFLSAQMVCGLTGQIYDVAIFIGRVNDQMAFSLTWQDLLDREGIFLLADGGYSDIRLITPSKMEDKLWNNAQKSLRSVVEHVNSIVHNFRYATVKVRGHSPELQAWSLRVIYNLAAMILDKYPLRSDLFLAGSHGL